MVINYKILAIIATVAFLFIFFRSKMKKSQQNELKMAAEDKLRDQALNKALANNIGDNIKKSNIENLPYEVDYDQNKLKGSSFKDTPVMLQLTECKELSKRKFMIELKDRIKIGRAKENQIVIKEKNVLPVQCEIFMHQNHVYIKDFSGGKTLLQRKKQTVYIDDKGIRLRTGDGIVISSTVLEVIIINNIE